MNVMAPEIDKETLEEMGRLTVPCLEDASYAVDGVTAFDSSHILITKKIGSVHQFVSLLRVGSLMNVTEEDAADCVNFIAEEARRANETGIRHRSIASINIDNAAAAMVETMRQALTLVEASQRSVVTCDPSHCIDLECTDISQCECFSSTIAMAMDIIRFVNIEPLGRHVMFERCMQRAML